MSSDARGLPTGSYWWDAACPLCGHRTFLHATITTTLTASDGPPVLRLKLTGKPVEHACGQTRLTTDAGALTFEDTQ